MLDAHHRYPWTPQDERFLIAAKRERYDHKSIARTLRRTPRSIDQKVKRLEGAGILLRVRKEELKQLDKLLAEAIQPDPYPDEVR